MNTKMSLSGCATRVHVGAERDGGFRVGMYIRPAMEDMWEVMSHFALFADRRDAERLAKAIERKREIDLIYWGWVPSVCAPIGAFHQPSPVKYEKMPRPFSGRHVFQD